MNRTIERDEDGMKFEYDFSGGVRGKHHLAYKAGTNVVFLDPDVASKFPDSEAVNRALRMVLQQADQASQNLAPSARP